MVGYDPMADICCAEIRQVLGVATLTRKTCTSQNGKNIQNVSF